MNLADCKVCKNAIIENEANGKTFYYCRTCKDERTVWGYELAKPETAKPAEERKVYAKDDFYGTYGGGHDQQPPRPLYQDPYYRPTTTSGQPPHLTQQEIDELFNDKYQGAD